jgi:hypothetical protein
MSLLYMAKPNIWSGLLLFLNVSNHPASVLHVTIFGQLFLCATDKLCRGFYFYFYNKVVIRGYILFGLI